MQRSQPADLTAEIAILGGILIGPQELSNVIQDLRPHHFYNENHGNVFQAFLNLYTSDEPIDNITVAHELEKMGAFNIHLDRGVIAAMQEEAITSSHVPHYAKIVIDKARKRRIMQTLRKGVHECEQDRDTSQDILNVVTRDLFDMTVEDSITNGVAHVGSGPIEEVIRQLKISRNGGIENLVKYKWPELDNIVPIRPGEVTVVCGRPSMGKSAFAINVATDLAVNKGIAVGIFSLEMPTHTLLKRMASEISGINAANIERNKLDDDEFKALIKAYEKIGSSPIYIDDAPGLDEATLIAKARSAVFKFDIKLFVLDYLQLMDGKGNNDNEKVGGCAKTIRKLARHLRVPWLEVCQLSRAPESRPDKHPILSDLRDSGNIEQEADVALGLYREDYYEREKSKAPNQAEIIIMKHRNGETGKVNLYFDKFRTSFKSLETRHAETA